MLWVWIGRVRLLIIAYLLSDKAVFYDLVNIFPLATLGKLLLLNDFELLSREVLHILLIQMDKLSLMTLANLLLHNASLIQENAMCS